MSNLYLDESLNEADVVVGNVLTLTGDEARHAVSVSRLREGEEILVGNGAGVQATARVVDASPKALVVDVLQVRSRAAATPQLVLVQSLAKGDRDERAVEASTEVGVDVIYPYQASRSVSRWAGEKRVRGRERWQKLAREATKQSLRFHMPHVEHPLDLESLAVLASTGMLIVLEPSADQRLSSITFAELEHVPRVILAVGPEGGFDDRELDALRAAGARLVALGDTVLRTSTAGVAALAVLNSTLRRW